MKAGTIKNHSWIGKKVVCKFTGEAGGVVVSVERCHTFSQMVPFKTVLWCRRDDGSVHEVRKDRARLAKEPTSDAPRAADELPERDFYEGDSPDY